MLALLYFLSALCNGSPWFLGYQEYYENTGLVSKQDYLRYIGGIRQLKIKSSEVFPHLPFINRDSYLMFRIRKHDSRIKEVFDSVCIFTYLNNTFDKCTNTSEGVAYLPIELVNYSSSDIFSLEYYINNKVYYEIASRPFFYCRETNRIQEVTLNTELMVFYSKVYELAKAMYFNEEEYSKIVRKYHEELKVPTAVDKWYDNYCEGKLSLPESKTKHKFDCLLREMMAKFYTQKSKLMRKKKLDKSISLDAFMTQVPQGLIQILVKYIAKMHVCEGQSTKGFEKALNALPEPNAAYMDKYFQDFTNCINLVYKVKHILDGKGELRERIVADMSFAVTEKQVPNYSFVLNMGEDKKTILLYSKLLELEVKDDGKNVSTTSSDISFDFENEVIIVMLNTVNAAKLTGSCVTVKLFVPNMDIEISREIKQDLKDQKADVASCSSASLSLGDKLSVDFSIPVESDIEKEVYPALGTATHGNDKSSKHSHLASKTKETHV